jgi:hypothetical protein
LIVRTLFESDRDLRYTYVNARTEKETGLPETAAPVRFAARNLIPRLVVSKNLGLDTNKVLDGLKTESLGQTLKEMGVSGDKAKAEIRKAKDEIKGNT